MVGCAGQSSASCMMFDYILASCMRQDIDVVAGYQIWQACQLFISQHTTVSWDLLGHNHLPYFSTFKG